MKRLTTCLWLMLALAAGLMLTGALPRSAIRVEPRKQPFAGISRVSGRAMIDLNRADEALLSSIPGVGPVLAARICAYIREKGALKAPSELMNVPGIGPEKLRAIEKMAFTG